MDLIAFIPSYLSLFLLGTQYLVVMRAFRLLRVFRILKLTQFLYEGNILKKALRASLYKIVMFLSSVITLVIRSLEEIARHRGYPKMIRVDNGPEFISAKLDIWSKENKIQLVFIQPGEPTQNAYIERLNGTLRRDILNAYVFKSIQEVRTITEEWMNV
ncbi:integrase core domain-containing protein [Pedobacter sp. Leaf132]|uniref:integrase core domain-containing protein n=1 Tax=unclassified Pedobacter TaxID=2628915 RepID=UPI00351CB93A